MLQVSAASVLFVDNPVGTGYSYTDSEEALTKDVAMVATDMMVLLQQFFNKQTEFQVQRKDPQVPNAARRCWRIITVIIDYGA